MSSLIKSSQSEEVKPVVNLKELTLSLKEMRSLIQPVTGKLYVSAVLTNIKIFKMGQKPSDHTKMYSNLWRVSKDMAICPLTLREMALCVDQDSLFK